MPFSRAARIGEVSVGTIHQFQVGGTAVALANVDGKFYAINDVCVHRGGPLGEGELEANIVTCPWHGWQYDVTTGKVTQNPTMGVACYATEVRGDEIFVDVP
jgi:nitrite reductase (NADH) small subunit